MARYVFRGRGEEANAAVGAELGIWAAPSAQASAANLIDSLGGQRAVLVQLGYDSPKAAGYRSAQRNLQRYTKEDGQSRTATGAFGARLRELATRQGIDMQGNPLARHARRNIRAMRITVRGTMQVSSDRRQRAVSLDIDAAAVLDALDDPMGAWVAEFLAETGQGVEVDQDDAFGLTVEVEADDD